MKITLVPYAGLCNRLNAIGSALAYKEKHPETEITILWHKWYHCNCRFNDIFKQLPPPYPPVQELRWRIKDLPGNKLNCFIPQKLRWIWYDVSVLNYMSADSFDGLTLNKNKIYVNHENRFCGEELSHGLSRVFVPTDELQKRINEVTQDWDKNHVVGLHIRRTDNAAAIRDSPIQHFYKVIESESALDSNVRFYVATDDISVKESLRERFGRRIIYSDLCLKRSSVRGMKDAVVDLFCLGMTDRIYGSAKSTYSTFAAKLFDKELII